MNCVTTVTLSAQNYCSFWKSSTVASFNPIQIFDLDDAAITADYTLLCYPDTVVHFTNSTAKNWRASRKYWLNGLNTGISEIIGDKGIDSIIDWAPFDPPAKAWL